MKSREKIKLMVALEICIHISNYLIRGKSQWIRSKQMMVSKYSLMTPRRELQIA